jgi:hypothetical protein
MKIQWLFDSELVFKELKPMILLSFEILTESKPKQSFFKNSKQLHLNTRMNYEP